jgi:BlaI family transcriptional regulator, penicillinase repressor
MSPRRKAKHPTPRRLLTEAELELMTVLWEREEATVAEVLACLPAGRRRAYTSVSTILRILEQKGVVTARPRGRQHVYSPRIPKQAYQATSLRHLVGRVFDGAPVALVRRLLEDEELTAAELAELRALVERRRPS